MHKDVGERGRERALKAARFDFGKTATKTDRMLRTHDRYSCMEQTSVCGQAGNVKEAEKVRQEQADKRRE
eukprot:2975955-Pleurochrysis_carterae.AAC.1